MFFKNSFDPKYIQFFTNIIWIKLAYIRINWTGLFLGCMALFLSKRKSPLFINTPLQLSLVCDLRHQENL